MGLHPIFGILGEAYVRGLAGPGSSPIELQLLAGIILVEKSLPSVGGTPDDILLEMHGLEGGKFVGWYWRREGWYIFSQLPIGDYVADFALFDPVGDRVVVECDGHDFHERTKEQAAHDRRRDRTMVADGWTVLRYTGSEIYRDPEACALDLLEHLDRIGDDGRHQKQLRETFNAFRGDDGGDDGNVHEVCE